MSRKMKIEADCLIEDVQNKNFSMIALPGGMPGAENLRLNSILKKMLEKHIHMDKVFVAAVCAAPAVVLGSHGLLALHEATAHPAHAAALPHRVDKRIVVSGNVITSQGPGTSLEFAITLVDALFGPRAAKSLQEAMLVHSFTV
jgi:4-methyl-5(b-hydroxyethyl)-thiazole monophosphate biosynthesis